MKRQRRILYNPTRVIEVILASMAAVLSFITLLTFDQIAPGTINEASPGGIYTVAFMTAVVLGLTGFLNLLANWYDNLFLRRWTMFAISIAAFFVAGLRLLVIGVTPLIWPWMFVVALIAMVCHMSVGNEYEQKIQRLDRFLRDL